MLLIGGLGDAAANKVPRSGDHARSAGTFLTCVPFNAITDAIGTEDLPMPATPQAVWRALQKANDRRTAA